MTDDERCGACRYFYFWKHSDEGLGVDEVLGECHRRAPLPVIGLRDEAEGGYDAHWPVVTSEEWCGEWQPRPKPLPTPAP